VLRGPVSLPQANCPMELVQQARGPVPMQLGFLTSDRCPATAPPVTGCLAQEASILAARSDALPPPAVGKARACGWLQSVVFHLSWARMWRLANSQAPKQK
jgi:hypothetical protein